MIVINSLQNDVWTRVNERHEELSEVLNRIIIKMSSTNNSKACFIDRAILVDECGNKLKDKNCIAKMEIQGASIIGDLYLTFEYKKELVPGSVFEFHIREEEPRGSLQLFMYELRHEGWIDISKKSMEDTENGSI